MERERQTSGNGQARAGGSAPASVVRDVMDHAAMIGRDFVKIGRLEARRYVAHLRRDVATRVAWGAVAAILGAVAALSGLIALFWGIAVAIGSVAWTFAIFAALFAAAAVVTGALAMRTPQRDEAEEIARRFPAARARESRPEHLLAEQQTSFDGHRRAVEEARRESDQMSRTPSGGSTSLATLEAPRKT